MSCWAVVPAKSFACAKTRLSPVLTRRARAAIARRMLDRVLRAAGDCEAVDGTVLVTSSRQVARLVRSKDIVVAPDPPDGGTLGDVVDAGLREAEARGADSAVVLMGDLPWVSGADVAELVRGLRDHEFVIAPDEERSSTNALALRLAERPSTAFGQTGSFAAHLSVLRGRGSVHVHDSAALAFDVDTPSDFVRLSSRR